METYDDIKPTGIASRLVCAPYNVGRKDLKEKGYQEITTAKQAQLRVLHGPEHRVSTYGNRVAEDFVYDDDVIYLTRNSVISQNPDLATETSKTGDFYLTPEQREWVLNKGKCYKFKTTKDYSIPTKRFGEEGETVFLFGLSQGEDLIQDAKDARDYGNFLSENKIPKMPVSFGSLQKGKTFARKMWFRYLDGLSGLVGYDRDLCLDYYRVRGVREDATASEPRAENLKRTSLDDSVETALTNKTQFMHNGTLYVPINSEFLK